MKTVRYLVVLGVVTGVMTPMRSAADDTLITGAKIKVVDVTQPGVARRKIVFGSKDPAIVAPADGGAGDPSLNGGSLRIVNTAGSGESDVFTLAAQNWIRSPSDPSSPLRVWKYKEVVANPPSADYKIKIGLSPGRVLKALVKDDRGNVITYTLDEATQGSIGIQVSTGSDRTCAQFGGVIIADENADLGDGVYRGRFVAKLAPAPPGCASPSGAFID
jgi:hypothetical protein